MNFDHQQSAHPNVHQAFNEWSHDQTLHVAVAYSNPFRWRVRRELLNNFRQHMRQSPNVKLYVGELAYGDRPFEVTSSENPLDLQMRTNHELFHKENILNAVIQRLPRDWKYGAIIDGDFTFNRHDWALETVHQLQHYDFVQLFSSYVDLSGQTLGTGHRIIRANNSFAYNYVSNGYRIPDTYDGAGRTKSTSAKDEYCYDQVEVGSSAKSKFAGATGGAWGFRRSAFDTVGGLLDTCILGAGDWFMAFGLAAEPVNTPSYELHSSGYRRAISEWQRRASRLNRNIGYVDNLAVHHFHGSKSRRFYGQRYKVLIENNFDPLSDLHKDWQGIYQLTPEKPALRDAIRSYFIVRSEDDPNIADGAGERFLL